MTDFLTSNRENRIYRGLDESEPAKLQRARIEAEQAQRRREEAEQRRAHADSLQDGGAGRSAVAADEDSGSDSGSEN
jgi:hypothetical protein